MRLIVSYSDRVELYITGVPPEQFQGSNAKVSMLKRGPRIKIILDERNLVLVNEEVIGNNRITIRSFPTTKEKILGLGFEIPPDVLKEVEKGEIARAFGAKVNE